MTTHTWTRLRAVWIVALATCGCSVLTANNKDLVRANVSLTSGDGAAALAHLDGREDLPGKLERAMILASMGRPEESNREFDRALVDIRTFEARATVSATEVATNTGSLLINDKTREYQGEGYEKVLVHTFKARNFLLLGDEEAARVEIRNANMRQDEERDRHAKAIAQAREEAEKDHMDLKDLNRQIDERFASSASILQRLDNVYQNPFATYLSGVVYELNGEPDDAFIDYRKAYDMVPNVVVGADLARVAAATGQLDEVRPIGLSAPPPSTPAGDLLVIVDNGLAPEREELKFPLPGPNTVLFAAVPMTRPIPTDMGEAEILDADDNVLGRTQILVDIEAMAVRNLRDLYPGILLRQAVRLAGKAVAGQQLSKELGLVGTLVSTSFNAVTEQADLRAWYALPRSIHVARVKVPAGSPTVRVRILDGADRLLRETDAALDTGTAHLKVVSLRYLSGGVMFNAPPANAQTARHEGSAP